MTQALYAHMNNKRKKNSQLHWKKKKGETQRQSQKGEYQVMVETDWSDALS
jgi:hypothetical protein